MHPLLAPLMRCHVLSSQKPINRTFETGSLEESAVRINLAPDHSPLLTRHSSLVLRVYSGKLLLTVALLLCAWYISTR